MGQEVAYRRDRHRVLEKPADIVVVHSFPAGCLTEPARRLRLRGVREDPPEEPGEVRILDPLHQSLKFLPERFDPPLRHGEIVG
jgi:hypothetical protein